MPPKLKKISPRQGNWSKAWDHSKKVHPKVHNLLLRIINRGFTKSHRRFQPMKDSMPWLSPVQQRYPLQLYLSPTSTRVWQKCSAALIQFWTCWDNGKRSVRSQSSEMLYSRCPESKIVNIHFWSVGVAFVEQYNLHLKSKVFLRDKLVAFCAMIKVGLSLRARVFPWLSVLLKF